MKKIALLIALLLATAVYAQDRLQQQKLQAGFTLFDGDKDRLLSEKEFKALGEYSPKLKGKPQVVEYLFEKLDLNHDRTLSLQEYLGLSAIDAEQIKASEESQIPYEAPTVEETAISDDQLLFFERRIRPILVEKCYSCHSGNSESIQGGLVLDTRAGIRRGGNSGPGIVPGNPSMSLVIEAIRFDNSDIQMPPEKSGGRLSEAVISDFEQWVRMGAPDPRDGQAQSVESEWDTEQAKSHWAFQPIVRSALPKLDDETWPKSDIDRYILSGLEAKGVSPNRDASPVALLRRLYFDLIGLPPDIDETSAFLEAYAKDGQSAIGSLVDRLLASPHFGERWGRHWLDVARYAESTGKDVNCLLPQAWRYRDYVIESFNQDKPIDDFLREQIAGDLLPAENERDRARKQIATGFLALGPRGLNERNPRQYALDAADEQIDTVTQAVLGLTVACARCHDHKFDPIPQRDYYALAGIFLSTETCYGTAATFQNIHPSELIDLPKNCGLPRMPKMLSTQQRDALTKELTKIERYGTLQFYGTALKAKISGQGLNVNNDPQKLVMFVGINAKIGEIKAELARYEADGTQKLTAIGVRDYPPTPARRLPTKPRSVPEAFELATGRPDQFRSINDSPLFGRGDVDKPGEKVKRGFLSLIPVKHSTISPNESGRRELSEWLVSIENPLTSRVFANRVWRWLFGSGIVESVDNFGTTGQAPSNQALLDHLALRLQENGWSLKSLIKEIVLSRSYQLASTYRPTNFELDPANALIWRMSPRRLDAECIRDAMLAISGRLQRTPPLGSIVAEQGDGGIGGYPIKSLRAPLSDELFLAADSDYRSVYLPLPRNAIPDSLTVFDFSEPTSVNGKREVTTVPSQALYLLNSEFVATAARLFAERLLRVEPEHRIEMAFQLSFARSPTENERKAVKQYFSDNPNRSSEIDAWTGLCRALMGSAEFRSID